MYHIPKGKIAQQDARYEELYIQALSSPINGVGANYEEMRDVAPLMAQIAEQSDQAGTTIVLTDFNYQLLCEYLVTARFDKNSVGVFQVIHQVLNREPQPVVVPAEEVEPEEAEDMSATEAANTS